MYFYTMLEIWYFYSNIFIDELHFKIFCHFKCAFCLGKNYYPLSLKKKIFIKTWIHVKVPSSQCGPLKFSYKFGITNA